MRRSLMSRRFFRLVVVPVLILWGDVDADVDFGDNDRGVVEADVTMLYKLVW